MKKASKRLLALLLMTLSLTMLLGISASADTYNEKQGAAINLGLYKGKAMFMIYDGPSSEFKWVKKPSTKYVKVVTETLGCDEILVYFILKKPGKVTYSYQIIDYFYGVTDTHNVTLGIFRYSNPFKTLKVGKTNYKNRFNKATFYSKAKTSKGKLQIKLNSGWKLSMIHKTTASEPDAGPTVKNNKNITLKKGDGLVIVLKNKKYGFKWGVQFRTR